MFSRILITGCNGFTGRHLVQRLRSAQLGTLVGLDVGPWAICSSDEYVRCDLTEAESVEQAVGTARPNVVYHLAAVTQGLGDDVVQRTNVDGFRNLCDALVRGSGERPIRMVTIGSAAEVGSRGAARSPVADDVECVPETAYGRSKWLVTQSALAHPVDGPLQIVVARPYNLVGPGLPAGLSLGHFARQVAAVAWGRAEAVDCGPLDARRDFLDVRDAVEAYVALAERGCAGQVYNVCQGCSYRIGDLLGKLIEYAGVPVSVRSDPTRQPLGVPDIYGDNRKLREHTNWQPRVSIEQSLRDLLETACEETRGQQNTNS